ncbi:hypothetical protein A3A84_03400 [Candidatus Collierbacteria bacterium RIFCSPLOWO2_01_FULL_50_23]|nr:MAG: hypothetical protein A3A84_03400 [Candidatus Collierbacteria bacterium RIFCSPLOWO2_01_FULL_50_23]
MSRHKKKSTKKSKPEPKMFHFLHGLINISRIIFVLLLLAVASLSYYLYSIYGKPSQPGSISVNRPNPEIPAGLIKAPTPYLLLPQGKQEYLIRSNPTKGDVVGKKIIADPLDAPKNSPQTISIVLEHIISIVSVAIEISMDTTTKTYPLSLTSGTQTNGTWSGSWTVADSHNQTYSAKFIITDQNKRQTILDFPIK